MNAKPVGEIMENIKLICLLDGTKLISSIEEVSADIGEPDCKLTKPYQFGTPIQGLPPTLESWMGNFTNQEVFMIHSDKILTITDPKPTLLEKYQSLTK
jgi:hypothetical protein